MEEETKFQNVLMGNDYKAVIRVFNKKEIVKSIGHFVGVPDKLYCQTIISLLNTEKKIKLLQHYCPIYQLKSQERYKLIDKHTF